MYVMRLYQQDPGSDYHFLVHLAAFHKLQFSDDRDRVYGLLALRNSSEPTAEETFVKPDYAVDKLEAYKRVAERCLLQENSLNILLYVHHEGHIDEEWASWVPDWCAIDYGWEGAVHMSDTGFEHLRIAKPTSPGPAGLDCVSIKGIRVGLIETILEIPIFDQQRQTLLKHLWDSFDPVCVAYSAVAGNDIRTLADPCLLTEEDEMAVLNRACYAYLQLDLANEPLPRILYTHNGHASTEHELLLRFAFCYRKNSTLKAKSYSFFVTEDGMLGIGPKIIQKGDVLVVLFGGPLPFILRPVGKLWRLVGACYVHDLRNGQAVHKWKESGEPAEDFCIY
jgi:hypothetical protein